MAAAKPHGCRLGRSATRTHGCLRVRRHQGPLPHRRVPGRPNHHVTILGDEIPLVHRRGRLWVVRRTLLGREQGQGRQHGGPRGRRRVGVIGVGRGGAFSRRGACCWSRPASSCPWTRQRWDHRAGRVLPRCSAARLKISPDVGPTCQQWREGRDIDKTGANMSLCMVGREK
jgi:hypothetical protein